MPGKIICSLPSLLLACVLLLTPGCSGRDAPGGAQAGGEEVAAVIADVNGFTSELLRRVETSSDVAAGVGEAQKLLAERGEVLRSRLVEARQSRAFRESDEARRRMLESEVDNTQRVARLKTAYMDKAMNDAEFSRQLDELVRDYQALYH